MSLFNKPNRFGGSGQKITLSAAGDLFPSSLGCISSVFLFRLAGCVEVLDNNTNNNDNSIDILQYSCLDWQAVLRYLRSSQRDSGRQGESGWFDPGPDKPVCLLPGSISSHNIQIAGFIQFDLSFEVNPKRAVS